MTDASRPNHNTIQQAKRRQSLSLPSRRKHIFMAGLICAILALIPYAYTLFLGDAKDALSFGTASVEPLAPREALAPLDDETLAVPDLLAGEIGAGQNPTLGFAGNPNATRPAQSVDALGNPILPIGGGAHPVQNSPAPETGLETGTGTPAISVSGPRTILIDGQAVGASALAPAPFAGLTVTNQYGSAPAKGSNGQTPLNSYNRPFTRSANKQPISIIIGGLGVNRRITQQAIDTLPPEVTLSFAAHVTGLQDWINRARQDGHEVMIEIPMESADFNPSESGADKTLLTTNSPDDNLRNMDWLLSRGQGYFGIINYNGDRFLTRADSAAPILSKLSDSGLGLITDGAFSVPTLPALSGSVSLPYRNSFGLIDPAPETALIQSQLDSLAGQARSGAAPIGVGFAYPETIEAITRWTSELSAKGLVLAPASHTLIK